MLLPYWKTEALVLALVLSVDLLGLVNPYLAKLIIDKAFGSKSLGLFIRLLLLGGGVFAVRAGITMLKDYRARQIRLRVSFDLNRRVLRHVEGLSFDYFQGKSSGEHLYKISSDIEKTADFITEIPSQAVFLLPTALFTLAVMFYINWQITLLSLSAVVFLYLPASYFIRQETELYRQIIRKAQGIFSTLNDLFSHILLIKVFGKESSETKRYLKRLISSIKIKKKEAALEIVGDNAIGTIGRLITVLITFYGGYQLIRGNLSLGSLTAIMVYFNQLTALHLKFITFSGRTAFGLVSCKRIQDILDARPDVTDIPGAGDLPVRAGEIVFRGVSFGYKEKQVLSRLNFKISAGSSVALAGLSGIGKTTVLNLIVRLYDPWEGEVSIDGCPLKGVKLVSLKRQVGVALQEPFLWNDTVENNIKYARPQASRGEVEGVARICLVEDFVRELADGYHTVIGENACKLSEGQKQKIAIARALLKKPKILILDEAMSSMDSASEEKIIRGIRKGYAGMTTIVVSHRFSAVKSADLVYFLKKADEMAIDTAAGLAGKDKDFYDLFAAQIKRSV